MRCLLITSTYPTATRPNQGSFNRAMVDQMRLRHDVRVIAPIPWPQLRVVEATAKTRGRIADDARQRIDVWHPISVYPPKLLRNQYHRFFECSIGATVRRVCQNWKPEIVLGYWLHPDAAAAVQVAKQSGAASIVMSGGTDMRVLTKDQGRRRAIMRVIEQADRLVLFSHDLAERARELGVDDSKVDVVYRGVDRDLFHPGDRASARTQCDLKSNDIVLSWVGRLTAIKNPVMVIRAAAIWKRHWGNRFRLLVIGDGPLHGSVERLCRQLGVADQVRMEGSLQQSELALRYQSSDVTVLTSHSEGTPNVLNESIACGTPFVATDVGGVSHLATPGLDRLVNADDVEAFATAVIDLVGHCPESQERTYVPGTPHQMLAALESTMRRAMNSHQSIPTAQEMRDVG